MKKLNFILLGIALIAFGCSDFLDEDNRSSTTTEEYYQSQEGFETLVNAGYSSLRELYSDMNSENDDQKNIPSFQGLTLLGTDLFCHAKKADGNELVDGYFQLTPDNDWVSKVFSNCYKAIQLHNLAIEWESKTVQTEVLPIRVAEIRFIRAYFYHVLLELYGGVSIVTEAFDTPITSFKRDSEADVYQFIINELTSIKDILPEQPTDFGRVSKGAAEHLLSLVHLSRGYTSFASNDDFEKSIEYATNVIDSGVYSLLANFEDVFTPGNEDNREIIFSVQFDQNSLINNVGGHSSHSWGGLFAGSQIGMPYRHGQIRPTDWSYMQYSSEDKRYPGSFMVEQNDPYYDAYDTSIADSDRVFSNIYPHPSILEDPNSPSPNNWFYLEDYTVWVPQGVEWEDQNYPWVKKFDDPTAITRSDNSRDIFVFRLAETYLLRAEAKINLGQSGDNDINTVRARSWDVQASGATLDDLLDERGRELLGEYKRWMDLRRMGKVKERVSQYNPTVKRAIDLGQNVFGDQDGKALRRPIPTDVIIRDSGDYGQNPGY